MADELLRALGTRQRALESAELPGMEAVEGEAGEALLDQMFASPDATTRQEVVDEEAVVPLKPRATVPWTAIAVFVAAAAALILWLGLRPAQVPGLPPYDATMLTGGPAAVRGDGEDVQPLVTLRSPADAVDWRIRPKTPVSVPVAVSLVATGEAGALVFASGVAAEVSDAGAVRLRGPLEAFIVLTPGRWRVDIVPTPAADVPRSADEAQARGRQRISVEVEIEAP